MRLLHYTSTPLEREHRLEDETRWYYGWDCAFGCIWDAEAVERIALVGGSEG